MFQLNEHVRVMDSTKLICFIRCPRKFFFEYVLGWREQSSIHLPFGAAWHSGMAFLLEKGYTEENVEGAFEAFFTTLQHECPNWKEMETEAKNPGRALEMLKLYVENYKDAEETEDILLHPTEIGGTVPISEDCIRRLSFRLDSVLKGKGGIYSLDHKTSSEISERWMKQWELSSQLLCYEHALDCIYGEEHVRGIVVNGAAFRKKNNSLADFIRVPLKRSLQQKEAWLHETNCYLDSLESNLEILVDNFDQHKDSSFMPTFPKREEGCDKYGGCPYHLLCVSWPNPLQNIDRIPSGFEVGFWDPLEGVRQVVSI